MGLDKSNLGSFMENDLANIAAAAFVDVEIQPVEKGSVNLFVRSSGCNFRRPVRMDEAFCVLEALIGAGFSVLSCGKSRIDQPPRASEVYGSLSSWFIFGRIGPQRC
jgi:hypothetical protein